MKWALVFLVSCAALVFSSISAESGPQMSKRPAERVVDVTITDPSDSTRKVDLDSKFLALLIIGIGHHEAHEGDAFACERVDLSMADGDLIVVTFKTPAGTKRTHMLTSFETLMGGFVSTVEAPTWDASSGTRIPIYNRLRDVSMNSSTLLQDGTTGAFVANDSLNANPTTFAGGIVLPSVYAFAVKNQSTGGGREVEEWILCPDTQYAVIFEAIGGPSNKAHLKLGWYEHTDE